MRGKPAGNAAAAALVREAVKKRGKADDVTIVVMDVDLNGHAPLAAHKVDKAHEHPPVKLVPKYPLVMHNTGTSVRVRSQRDIKMPLARSVRRTASLASPCVLTPKPAACCLLGVAKRALFATGLYINHPLAVRRFLFLVCRHVNSTLHSKYGCKEGLTTPNHIHGGLIAPLTNGQQRYHTP